MVHAIFRLKNAQISHANKFYSSVFFMKAIQHVFKKVFVLQQFHESIFFTAEAGQSCQPFLSHATSDKDLNSFQARERSFGASGSEGMLNCEFQHINSTKDIRRWHSLFFSKEIFSNLHFFKRETVT